MPQKKIENLISQLHEEFAGADSSDAQAKLLQGLERHLHAEGSVAEEEPDLVDTLDGLFAEFGDEHPGVSRILAETLRALKNMGI